MKLKDDDLIRLVNENSNYRKVADYIISKFAINLDVNEAKDIAMYLIKIKKCDVDEILIGEEDDKIKQFLHINEIKKNSVKNGSTSNSKVQLKTTKKSVGKTVITLALGVTFAASLYFGHEIIDSSKEMITDYEISSYIGMLAASPGSEDYEHHRSIVNQNKYMVSRDQNGNPIIAYNFDKMALDVIDISKKDPDLFDITLNDIYFDLENKLESMDELFRYLKIYTKNDESLQLLYDKIKDYDIFLDYLLSRGLVTNEDKNYNLLVQDIEDYKALKTSNNVAYNALSKDAQSRIDDLINKYKNQKKLLNELYGNKLEKLVNEQEDSYGRN